MRLVNFLRQAQQIKPGDRIDLGGVTWKVASNVPVFNTSRRQISLYNDFEQGSAVLLIASDYPLEIEMEVE